MSGATISAVTITKLEVSIRNHQWQPDWRLWILALVLFPLLLWLGFWQLDRAGEKIRHQQHLESLSPVEWPVDAAAAEGQPVIIHGRYLDGRQWLLDNRTRNGRVGYEVLTLFEAETGPPVIINRGWLPGMRERTQLPAVDVVTGSQRLEAVVARWPAPPIVGDVTHAEGWPKRVQFLTREVAAENSGRMPAPVFLRLADAKQPGALRVDWPPPHSGADTHYGYAVQWFGLAIALAALTLVASFRKTSDRADNDRSG